MYELIYRELEIRNSVWLFRKFRTYVIRFAYLIGEVLIAHQVDFLQKQRDISSYTALIKHNIKPKIELKEIIRIKS